MLGRRGQSSISFISHLLPALISSFFWPCIYEAETFRSRCRNKIKLFRNWQGATIISMEVLTNQQNTGSELWWDSSYFFGIEERVLKCQPAVLRGTKTLYVSPNREIQTSWFSPHLILPRSCWILSKNPKHRKKVWSWKCSAMRKTQIYTDLTTSPLTPCPISGHGK